MVEPWKKALVEPQQYVPYLILVCLARSSALLIGESILAAVKKAKKAADKCVGDCAQCALYIGLCKLMSFMFVSIMDL